MPSTAVGRSGRSRLREALPLLISLVVAIALGAGAVIFGAPRPALESSVFSSATRPVTVTVPDANAIEVGVRFSASRDITVMAIRFYQGPENAGPHVGHIWTADGELLRTAAFPSGHREGWVSATLDTPLSVPAGEDLVASYVAPKGHYSADPQRFTDPVTDGVVTFPRGAGVYTYDLGSVPQQHWRNSNYYVDIAYRLGADSAPGATRTAEPAPTPTAASTPDSATPGASPPASAAAAAGSGAAVLGLPRVAWWGGPSYYARFSKATASGWTSSSFFPIAVFLGKPEQAAALRAAGINTYMGAEHDGSPISTITSTGMSVIAQDEWTRAEVGNDPGVVGWHVSDECDMGLSGCDGTTEAARLAQQRQKASALSFNDGRFLQSNIGNGVLGTFWAPTTMPQFVSTVDVTSVDKYAYTSPPVDDIIKQSSHWPKGRNPASSGAYGWLQDQMETFSNAATPNWVFVETAKPYLTESDARTIQPDQIEGAVWNAIIHGAAGIAYFQHNNNGTCGTYSILQCGAALTAKITAIDQQVQSLAPVINTQGYEWSFGTGLDTSLKVSGGYAYIFAMTDGSTGSKTFTLPGGLGTSVEVVGENRTITARNGSFTDSFAAEYTHHIYKIPLR